MPWLSGSTTLSASSVAKAASIALPPLRSISAPASAARGSAALTMPGTRANVAAWATGILAIAAGPVATSNPAMSANEEWRMGVELLAPDRLGNVGEALAFDPLGEPARDPCADVRPLINHGGIQLDQAGAGANPLPCVIGRCDPAHADQRDFARARPAEAAQRFEREWLERSARQSARLGRMARLERPPGHGGVGDDDRVDLVVERGTDAPLGIVLSEI